MDRLEQYVESGDYFRDKSDLKRWRDLLVKALESFKRFPVPGKNRWSYRLPHEGGAPPLSSSTSSMVLFTIARCLGSLEHSELVPYTRRPANLGDMATELCKRFEEALKELYENRETKEFLRSKTWGQNDPLTLCWLQELLILCRDQPESPVKHKSIAALHDVVVARIGNVLRRALNDKAILDWTGCFPRRAEAPISARHMLPMLRCVQLWSRRETMGVDVDDASSDRIERIRKQCWATLHAQLTAADVPHGDFDAAELVHSAEAIMLLGDGPKSLGADLLDRIFKTLHDWQERSAYWRPLKPITQSPRGPVLLPISVEIANSILRIHARMCETDLAADQAQSRLDLARRYAAWLETRARSVRSDGKVVWGWASEHIDEPNVIHTWQTSQVLLFLADLIEAVDCQMGDRMREGGLFELVDPEEPKDAAGEREPLLGIRRETEDNQAARQVALEILPYTVLHEHYISPTAAGKEAAVSMLLYGPPGTGKTSFAGQLAKHLGWSLLTITPSDFIAGGVEQVERRAKAIFAMLEHQRKTVVLLDEIDRLILDRDRSDYGAQGDMFQSMTPSMLGKISDLRDHCTDVVFIIGTNYKERIDPAIIRPGRIDQACLLAPPDQEQRKGILTAARHVQKEQIEQTAGRCALMVYKELEKVEGPIAPEANPSLHLASYGRRFQPTLTPQQMPLLEFWVLVALEQEGREFDGVAPNERRSDRSAQRALVKGIWGTRDDWKLTKEEDLLKLEPKEHPITRDELDALLKCEELEPGRAFLTTDRLEQALKHYGLLKGG